MAEPYLIRRDGTVLDRDSGDVCGIVACNDALREWVGMIKNHASPPLYGDTRRAAAEALYRRWKETR